jgi:hypothetical protein
VLVVADDAEDVGITQLAVDVRAPAAHEIPFEDCARVIGTDSDRQYLATDNPLPQQRKVLSAMTAHVFSKPHAI